MKRWLPTRTRGCSCPGDPSRDKVPQEACGYHPVRSSMQPSDTTVMESHWVGEGELPDAGRLCGKLSFLRDVLSYTCGRCVNAAGEMWTIGAVGITFS